MTIQALRERFPNASEQFLRINATDYGPPRTIVGKRRKWTALEIAQIEAVYKAGSPFCIEDVAKTMNRTRIAVALKASELGLTANRGEQLKTEQHCANLSTAQKLRTRTPESREKMRQIAVAFHANNPHPRGFLGFHHTAEAREAISSKNTGRAPNPDAILAAQKTKMARYGTVAPPHGHPGTSWKAEWVELGGQRFYARSRWEANYGRYLEWQRVQGLIESWEHEPETFWFEGIKRGCMSYLPDFRVILKTGAVEFHEVKGWMDARSITKIARMAKYHPTVKLIVIDGKRYRVLARQLKDIVPNWTTS